MALDQWVAVATTTSAVATAAIAIVAFRLSRSTATYAALRTIGTLANALAQVRLDYPDVPRRGRQWRPPDWALVYGAAGAQASAGVDSDRAAQYYAYIDIGLEFCNATLSAKADRTVDSDRIDAHYGRLVKLFVVENWPILDDMMRKPYLSEQFRAFVDTGPGDSTSWQAAHDRFYAG